MQDSLLRQIGSFARNGTFVSGQPLQGVDADAEITVVELPGSTCSASDLCQLGRRADGLSATSLNGEPVRAFLSARADGRRFAVVQRLAFRQEIASELALRALYPIAASIPCLMLVAGLVIAYSFRPMIAVARDLDARRSDDLTALEFDHTPSELSPFIASLNRLLGRVAQMIERQRGFIGDAAHELRTPITALGLQMENLALVELPAEARGRLTSLKEGMRRTKHLLEQLLALAREDANGAPLGELKALDRIATEVVANLILLADQTDVDLGFVRLEPVAIRGDSLAISTMLRNLIDNAVRYTPSGGRVDIAVFREGNDAVIQIEDSGPGVLERDIEQLFEPFFRGSEPDGEGTGLGLAIAKRVVLRLGGAIYMENGAAGGLCVIVRVPAGGSHL
jgi:two-component system OmpR family sensor kinase